MFLKLRPGHSLQGDLARILPPSRTPGRPQSGVGGRLHVRGLVTGVDRPLRGANFVRQRPAVLSEKLSHGGDGHLGRRQPCTSTRAGDPSPAVSSTRSMADLDEQWAVYPPGWPSLPRVEEISTTFPPAPCSIICRPPAFAVSRHPLRKPVLPGQEATKGTFLARVDTAVIGSVAWRNNLMCWRRNLGRRKRLHHLSPHAQLVEPKLSQVFCRSLPNSAHGQPNREPSTGAE